MRELVELIAFVKHGKLNSGELRQFILEPGSKMEQLFDAILQQSVQSDEAAVALLYGSARETAKYQSLKNKLKDRIIDAVFLLDFRDAGLSNRQKAYYECNKKWAAAMVLLSKNAKSIGINIFERLLRHTLHFEFTELTLGILYQLRLHYSTIEGDLKKYETCRRDYSRYQQVWAAENEAEELYTELISQMVNSKATQLELSTTAQIYYTRIEPHLAQSQSFRLHLCGRLLELMIYSSRGDHQATARQCEQAIAFFEQKPYENFLPLQAFYYQLVVCYIQLKAFDLGQKTVEKFQAVFEEGSFNWFD